MLTAHASVRDRVEQARAAFSWILHARRSLDARRHVDAARAAPARIASPTLSGVSPPARTTAAPRARSRGRRASRRSVPCRRAAPDRARRAAPASSSASAGVDADRHRRQRDRSQHRQRQRRSVRRLVAVQLHRAECPHVAASPTMRRVGRSTNTPTGRHERRQRRDDRRAPASGVDRSAGCFGQNTKPSASAPSAAASGRVGDSRDAADLDAVIAAPPREAGRPARRRDRAAVMKRSPIRNAW